MPAAWRGGTNGTRCRAHGRHVQGAGRPGSPTAFLPGRRAPERRSLRLRHPERGRLSAHGQPPLEETEGGRSDYFRAPGYLGLLPGRAWRAARDGADALAARAEQLTRVTRREPPEHLLTGSEQTSRRHAKGLLRVRTRQLASGASRAVRGPG